MSAPDKGPSGDLAARGHLNLMEFCRESARWSGGAGAVHEAGGMMFFQTGSDVPVLCNGAFRLTPQVTAGELIRAADAWFGPRERGYTVWALPSDGDLAEACLAAGLHEFAGSPEMACTQRLPDAPLPPGCELRWVTTPADVADFVAVSSAAYVELGLPPEAPGEIIVEPDRFCAPHVRSVVADLDGRPVAAAQTVLSHGIAGVYWVGTHPEARGRGLGEAVTRAVTNEAFDLGATANTLQASKMGEPIYERMGYRTIYRYRGFVRVADGGN